MGPMGAWLSGGGAGGGAGGGGAGAAGGGGLGVEAQADKVTAAAQASGLTRAEGVGLTAWFWVAAVCAVVSVVATAAAVRFAPAWPAMGSRYDAPGASPAAAPTGSTTGEVEEIDLWKSMDEGHDPTA